MQGEFEKRIRREFKIAYEQQYSLLKPKNNVEVAGMLRVGILPNILKLVEKTHKEFPNTIAVAIRREEGSDINYMEWYDSSEIKEWFERWFGK